MILNGEPVGCSPFSILVGSDEDELLVAALKKLTHDGDRKLGLISFRLRILSSGIGVVIGLAMGQYCSRKNHAKIVMLGLDSAGKTTILYRLKLNEFVVTVPTIGFNSEKLDYKNFQLSVWDVGGKEEVRGFWKHYVAGAQGIVFVVDSTDRARLAEAGEVLSSVLALDELSSAVLLVLANKQDLPNAMPPAEVANELGLSDNLTQTWMIQPTDAVNGNGLDSGLDRLTDALLKHHFRPQSCPCKLPCACL